MSKRRTRKDKIHASVHPFPIAPAANTTMKQAITAPVASTSRPVSFYVPEFSLSLTSLRKDLTKSLGLTILALILQFSLAVYLNRGGWQQINSMLQKMFSGVI